MLMKAFTVLCISGVTPDMSLFKKSASHLLPYLRSPSTSKAVRKIATSPSLWDVIIEHACAVSFFIKKHHLFNSLEAVLKSYSWISLGFEIRPVYSPKFQTFIHGISNI